MRLADLCHTDEKKRAAAGGWQGSGNDYGKSSPVSTTFSTRCAHHMMGKEEIFWQILCFFGCLPPGMHDKFPLIPNEYSF